MIVAGNSTSVFTYFVMRLASNGQAALGLAPGSFTLQFTTAGQDPSGVQLGIALIGPSSNWVPYGVVEVNGASSPGLYRIDWPDSAFYAGFRSVVLSVNQPNCFAEHLLVEIDARTVLANSNLHGGNAARVVLERLTVSSATNGPAIQLVASGAGDALELIGGSLGGSGLRAVGGAGGNGPGIAVEGDGVGAGLLLTGGVSGIGLHARGGTTTGDGAQFLARAGNSDGLQVTGFGTGWSLNTPGNISGSVASVRDGATAVEVQRVLDRGEYSKAYDAVTGSSFYVNGLTGLDSNAGTRALPKKTISAALALCVAGRHDEIVLLPGGTSAQTVITETATIVVNKSNVSIRGPGRDVLVTRSNDGTVFQISGDGISLSGFIIKTFGVTGAQDAVEVSNGSTAALLYRVFIEQAGRDGILLNVTNGALIRECIIKGAGRDGVRIANGAGSGTQNSVVGSWIRDCVTGISLLGPDASDCRIQGNVIRDCVTGIDILAGTVDTIVTDNRIAHNTTAIQDAGTRTLQAWNFLSTDQQGNVTLSQAMQEAIATTLLDLLNGVETNKTVRQALRLVLSTAAGKLSGATGGVGNDNILIRDTTDTKTRVSATVDPNGNRLSVTLDAS
jgi:hypothetical protein